MQTLDLNLAGRPFKNNVVLWIGYSLSLLLLVAFTVWNGVTYSQHAGQLRELRGEVNSIESQMRDLETRGVRAQNGVEKFDLEALSIQADKANEVIRWKAFSWTGLFNRLAEALPWNVRMSSIRPIFHAGRSAPGEVKGVESVPVAVDGIAKSYDDMLEMQNALFEHPNFGRVEMDRFSTALNNEIVFQMRFLYYPEAEPADEPTVIAAEGGGDEPGDPAALEQIPETEPQAVEGSAETEPRSAPKTPANSRVRRVVDPSEADDDGGAP